MQILLILHLSKNIKHDNYVTMLRSNKKSFVGKQWVVKNEHEPNPVL